MDSKKEIKKQKGVLSVDEIKKLCKSVYEESKRQAKERRDRGKNMIRPFTFDEEKILRDGLFNDGYKRKNI